MNLRAQPDLPPSQPDLETGGADRFDTLIRLRTAEAAALVREDIRVIRTDITNLSGEVGAQADQIAEFGKGLIAIWTLMMRGPEKSRDNGLYAQLGAIADRLTAIENRLDGLDKGPAADGPDTRVSVAPPRRPAAPPQVAPQPRSTRDDQDVHVAADFPAAWRQLALTLALEDASTLLDEVNSGVELRLAWSANREEAIVRSVFNNLASLDPAPQTDALRTFVRAMLGGSADLIAPAPGDKFEPAFHEDFSQRTTGVRSQVRELIFPGVKRRDQVLLRAIIHT